MKAQDEIYRKGLGALSPSLSLFLSLSFAILFSTLVHFISHLEDILFLDMIDIFIEKF